MMKAVMLRPTLSTEHSHPPAAMAYIALFVSMALCVAGSSPSVEQDLQELKADVWAGFKEMMLEVQGKYDTYDGSGSLKEFVEPFAIKHKGVGQKIQDFKEKHPEADVGPQSLITLSTEQTQKLHTEVAAGGTWLCNLARGPISLAAGVYCNAVFGWNFQAFDIWACFVSFLIPFEAVCLPR